MAPPQDELLGPDAEGLMSEIDELASLRASGVKIDPEDLS